MSERTHFEEIVEAVELCLMDLDVEYFLDEESGLFQFNIKLKSKINEIQYIIKVEENSMLAYGRSPIGVDPDDKQMISEMAEFVCRVNRDLVNGGFVFDVSTGELGYKSFIDCEGLMPSDEVIKNSMICIGSMFRVFSGGIIALICGGSSVEDAIAKCEME